MGCVAPPWLQAFFSNFGTLVLLGIVGTFLNAALLAVGASIALTAAGLDQHELLGNSLALGAVFSSTASAALPLLPVLGQLFVSSLPLRTPRLVCTIFDFRIGITLNSLSHPPT